MANINIRKGHDVGIRGVPKKEVVVGKTPTVVGVYPIEFRGVKPKLSVQVGDAVKIGSPLFYNKQDPRIRWPSPGAGRILEIRRGPRRVLEKITLQLDREEESVEHSPLQRQEILALDREKLIQRILEGNLWPIIRQRPFNKVANPEDTPRDIFISGVNTAPLTVDLDLALEGQLTNFQAGIDALRRLSNGKVYLTISKSSTSETLTQVEGVERNTVTGPHPAGNVGIQIHHLAPIKPGDVVWTILAQHVVTLGKFLLTGRYDPTLIITLGGPSVKNPIHIKTRTGVFVSTLLDDNLEEEESRIISGDVLTGHTISRKGLLRFYDSTISVLPVKHEREFLGMLRLGTKKTRYSLTNAFLAGSNHSFAFSTMQNGVERAIVPLNAWERVLPMDILPNFLVRAILAKDIVEMEQLGILECDEEDFALCSFACPSKIDVAGIIRRGLDLMELEG